MKWLICENYSFEGMWALRIVKKTPLGKPDSFAKSDLRIAKNFKRQNLSILPRRGSNYTYPLSIFRYYDQSVRQVEEREYLELFRSTRK